MRMFLKILLVFHVIAGSLAFGETGVKISSDFEIVQLLSIEGKVVKIGLLRTADAKKVYTQIGAELDGYKILGIAQIGKEQFVKTSKGEASFLFAKKRTDSAPFLDGPLLKSYENGLIDAQGLLTEKGARGIRNNLRQVASAGQQYILEEGATSVGYDKLLGEYFNKIPPVAGESYEEIVVSERGGELVVKTLFGEEVSFRF
ncbi:MAG: hypothetical protein ACPGN3_13655 [Opitutales bacterium]